MNTISSMRRMKVQRGFHRSRGWWHGKFRDCGHRMTNPREAILGVLSKMADHPSAEDIYLEVVKVHPRMGLTTVYRTLALLVQMGVVSRFDFGDRRSRYEIAQGPEGVPQDPGQGCNH